MADIYGEPIIIVTEKGRHRVYHPILTEEEYQRRETDVIKASIEIIKAQMDAKRAKVI